MGKKTEKIKKESAIRSDINISSFKKKRFLKKAIVIIIPLNLKLVRPDRYRTLMLTNTAGFLVKI